MLLPTFTANLLWFMSGSVSWLRFRHASRSPKQGQMRILKRILEANATSEYGHACDFRTIRDYEDFKDHVPLIQYEDIREDILRMAGGAHNILTSNSVTLFEPSGGSSVGVKFIPYTTSMAAEFDRGIRPWITNLFLKTPGLLGGKAYWSISPANAVPEIPGAQIPVGFKDDTEYLSGFARRLMAKIMAVPNWMSQIENPEDHRYLTLFFLLKVKDLRLISVWNPTFLSLLLEQIQPRWTQLIQDIKDGTPRGVSAETRALVEGMSRIKPDPQRASELRALDPGAPSRFWPNLRLVSCWMDGPSRNFAQELKDKYFPEVTFQSKGLLATEAFVSLPIVGVTGCPLAINSHFFEFIPYTPNQDFDPNHTLMAHELEAGKQYLVVVTTSGGLYRYQLNDIIRVTGLYKQTPCIEFESKSGQFSDLFGEKLSQAFVASELDKTFRSIRLSPAFYLVAPRQEQQSYSYALYLELHDAEFIDLESLACQIDEAFRTNFHYDYCRNLGQLGQLQIHLVPQGSAHRYLQQKAAQGQKLGDIKPSVLDPNPGWDKIFEVHA